jgi:hypothetical protein
MASTPQERLADKTDTSSIRSDKKRFWDASEKLRSDLAVAGFWDTLEQNCNQWADDVTVSPFWKAVKDRQLTWSNDFQRKTSGALLANPGIPPFVPKTIKRAREKLLHDWIRADRPENVARFWPASGPPVPLINDLVRTRVECQFLDGVEFFGNRLEELASELGVQHERQRQGRLVGYFAQHFCFEQKVIFRFGGGEQLAIVQCEVQIATALATRIWEESHRTYEEWRVQTEEAEDWQWNPSDPRFTARQLGHMIHLADGLLVQLRNSTHKHI